jgi:hypothetical protein
MKNEPSNTREQCAFDRGAQRAREALVCTEMMNAGVASAQMRAHRDGRNPHKKGSVEYTFWNEGFDSV